MSSTTVIKHPLVRDGKSQNERLDLGVLAPNTLALDDRDERQLLAYLYEYAKSVAYYDLEDGSISNWQDFFRSGVAVQTAIISQNNSESWQHQFDEVLRDFTDGLSRSNLSPLLDFLFETAISIDSWQKALSNDTAVVDGKVVVNENDLQRVIRNLIASNLAGTLAQLIAVANVWGDKPTPSRQRNYDLPDLSALDQEDKLWKISQPVTSARDASLQKLINHPSDFEQAASQKLNNVFQVFFKAILDITGAAKTLNLTPPTETHAPHLGLLYAFLRLFKQVRDSLNGLTKQHLDFYYRDVLGLKTKQHQPDTAHVVFELNKPAAPHRLIADTPLKGGKDPKGAEIRFELENEIIVSKAQIQTLRTLYNETGLNSAPDKGKKIYAAPFANSADGRGAAFEDPTLASWPTLGKTDEQLPARLGLMIAAPALRLEEGERKIEIIVKSNPFLNWVNFTKASYFIVTANSIFNIIELFKSISNTPLNVDDLIPDTLYEEDFEDIKNRLKLILQPKNNIVHLDQLLTAIGSNTAYFDKRLNLHSFQPTDASFKLLNKNEAQKITGKKYVGTNNTVLTQILTDIQPGSDDSYPGRTVLPNGLINTFEKTGPFIVELSGKKGWFKPVDTPAIIENRIIIALGPKEEAILDADPAALKADFGVTQPIVRLTLNPDIFSDIKPDRSLYEFFDNITIDSVDLKITVSGLQNVTINTDEGAADPKKAFLPFGPVPMPNKRFSVDHPSFYDSNFTECTLVFEWDQLPLSGFEDHYKPYRLGSPIIDDAYFKTEVKINMSPYKDKPINPNIDHSNPHRLFNDYNVQNYHKIEFKYVTIAPGIPKPLNEPILFTLLQEFFHGIYPDILAKNMLALGDSTQQIKPITLTDLTNLQTDIDSKTSTQSACNAQILDIKSQIKADVTSLSSKSAIIPPAPYTPIIKSVTLSYVVTATGTDVTLFHLHPFEESNYQKITQGSSFLPEFDFEGALLLGLSEVNPGSTIDLLFQFNETSADAYLDPVELEWYYLYQNEWKLLNKGTNVIHDDTKGFIRSGIVQLALPFDFDQKPTILPRDLCWLKVSTADPTDAVCRAVGVHTQAAKAVFHAETANDLSRLSKPLEAGSISKLLEPNADIKGVLQPYGTYSGRAPEDDNAFYVRVSEQLRHKGRAVSLFDYEQLILEAFQDIYKVKCITHTLPPRVSRAKQANFSDLQAAPGYVTIVVIPKLAHLPVADRFQPQASPGQLEAIKDFLAPRVSPFVRLRVMNPGFDRINTRIDVKFKTGKSPEFYKEQLDTDLKQYLSPWAFNPDAKIPFGGTVFQSALLGFIESREYVDYVEEFTMWKNGEDPPDSGELTTSSARAILVSGEHTINKPL